MPGITAITVFTPSSSTTSVRYLFPSFAVSLSCLQIVINCKLRRFNCTQYIRGFLLFVRASAMSTAQNHHLKVFSSQTARTGISSKKRIEVFSILLRPKINLRFIPQGTNKFNHSHKSMGARLSTCAHSLAHVIFYPYIYYCSVRYRLYFVFCA